MKKSKKKKGNSAAAFCRALKKHDHYLLTCHVSPEGDAIGSMLAMESLLRRLGKKTTVLCQDVFPTRLPCFSEKRWKRPHQLRKPKSAFKAIVLSDCPNLDRIGRVREWITPETVIFNVDHHISNGHFGDYNYVRSGAAATGEVVYDLFEQLKMPLRREDAKHLYVAISTDTGSFKYNATAHSHRVAARLIASGIDVDKINDQIYGNYHLNKTQLYGRLLGRIRTAFRGRVAWVGMRRSDLKQSGATYEDTEGFIDFLKYMKEVKVAFFMTEQKGKQVRVSFRSKDKYDVNKLAAVLGGGGHRHASGCILDGTLASAEGIILKRVRKEFRLK